MLYVALGYLRQKPFNRLIVCSPLIFSSAYPRFKSNQTVSPRTVSLNSSLLLVPCRCTGSTTGRLRLFEAVIHPHALGPPSIDAGSNAYSQNYRPTKISYRIQSTFRRCPVRLTSGTTSRTTQSLPTRKQQPLVNLTARSSKRVLSLLVVQEQLPTFA